MDDVEASLMLLRTGFIFHLMKVMLRDPLSEIKNDGYVRFFPTRRARHKNENSKSRIFWREQRKEIKKNQ